MHRTPYTVHRYIRNPSLDAHACTHVSRRPRVNAYALQRIVPSRREYFVSLRRIEYLLILDSRSPIDSPYPRLRKGFRVVRIPFAVTFQLEFSLVSTPWKNCRRRTRETPARNALGCYLRNRARGKPRGNRVEHIFLLLFVSLSWRGVRRATTAARDSGRM